MSMRRHPQLVRLLKQTATLLALLLAFAGSADAGIGLPNGSDGLLSPVTSTLDGVTTTTSGAVDGTVSTTGQTVGTVEDTVGQAQGTLTQTVDQAGSTLTQTVEQTGTTLTQTVEQSESTLTQTVEQTVTTASETVDQLAAPAGTTQPPSDAATSTTAAAEGSSATVTATTPVSGATSPPGYEPPTPQAVPEIGQAPDIARIVFYKAAEASAPVRPGGPPGPATSEAAALPDSAHVPISPATARTASSNPSSGALPFVPPPRPDGPFDASSLLLLGGGMGGVSPLVLGALLGLLAFSFLSGLGPRLRPPADLARPPDVVFPLERPG